MPTTPTITPIFCNRNNVILDWSLCSVMCISSGNYNEKNKYLLAVHRYRGNETRNFRVKLFTDTEIDDFFEEVRTL